ncbi:outer membrane beta-barrel protein [Ensifer sp. HO-A22]|uniref:Outer membrane beta-barrel protein n=1 Tax=Ensifer oleiphilus TaxID=2742698 RepID=A0A7Y6QA29_9HYPH|nr:outer membrane beta-barrel protein [Ensifer oleiphilus]NVD41575.1 outer membrane beta-barrel protein [Ensifer oleiphilus]
MVPDDLRSTGRDARRFTLMALLLAGTALAAPLPSHAQTVANSTPPGVVAPGTATTMPAISDPQTTGAVSTDDLSPASDEDLVRLNRREPTLDGLRTRIDPDDDRAVGVRIGTFTLRPEIGETLNHEWRKDGDTKQNRGYLETGIRGTLTSDWSRHALTVTGAGVIQNNISGEGEEEPRADIDAELRLDLWDETIARLRAGYSFYREDADDPNAISNAKTQSGVNTYRLGAAIERDFGLIRGSVGLDLERQTYGNVELENGTTLSVEDRNRNSGTLTARVGYEMSPALIPFIEAAVGRSTYDLRQDTLGFERSYQSYATRGGLEVDLGEKLNGEIALGYETYRFEDDRLSDVSGLSVDGRLNWSPQRGTDVLFGLSTGLDPSTTAGVSGSIDYTLINIITHEMRSDLVARLSNTLTIRKYPSDSRSSDETTWRTGAGLTWDMNRYLALTGDVSYERTTPDVGDATDITRVGVGLVLRR